MILIGVRPGFFGDSHQLKHLSGETDFNRFDLEKTAHLLMKLMPLLVNLAMYTRQIPVETDFKMILT